MSETQDESAMTFGELADVLTLGEIAQIEELSGLSMDSMSDSEKPKGRLLIAIAAIAGRRVRPGFTINEAEALTGKGLNELVRQIGESVRPAIVEAPVMVGGADPEG